MVAPLVYVVLALLANPVTVDTMGISSDSPLKPYAQIGEDIRLQTGLTTDAEVTQRYIDEIDKFSQNQTYSPIGLDVAMKRMEIIQERLQTKNTSSDQKARNAIQVLENNQAKIQLIKARIVQHRDEKLENKVSKIILDSKILVDEKDKKSKENKTVEFQNKVGVGSSCGGASDMGTCTNGLICLNGICTPPGQKGTESCGGIVGKACPEGYKCKYANNVPDASGICEPQGQIVGGDTDIHGCKGSAGYTWNETAQLCMRPWSGETYKPNGKSQ